MMNKTLENRVLKTVTFNVLDKGLGICIIGGNDKSNPNPGIFVKSISPGGLASLDGRLQEGDQLMSVNGESFANISCDESVELLKKVSEEGFVQLKICRDYKTRQNYKQVCEMYAFSRPQSPEGVITGRDKITINSLDSNPASPRRDFLDQRGGKDAKSKPLDPMSRVNIERLLQSLDFLGIHLTGEEKTEMKSRLDVDQEGTVSYGEFVKLAKQLFTSHTVQPNSFKMSATSFMNQHLGFNNVEDGNTASLSNENQYLTKLVKQKDGMISSLEKELVRYRNEHHIIKEELKNVNSQFKLSEEAQKAARKAEEDYEVVLRHLEKDKLTKKYPDLREEVEFLQYQTKSYETNKELLRNANEKLFNFTKFVADSLKKRKEQKYIHDALKRSVSVPLYLDFSLSDDIMLSEAERTIKAVQSLLELESPSFTPVTWKRRNK